MGTLSLTKNYSDSTLLYQADFDVFITELETFLNTTKINDDNLQNAGITASSKLLDGSVSTAKIANSAVTTTEIVAGAVTEEKLDALAIPSGSIAAGAITTAKIIDNSISTTELGNQAVGDDQVADTNITKAKLASFNYSLSSSSSTFSTTGTSETDATNLSVSLTTTGKPVWIGLVPDGSANASYVGANDSPGQLAGFIGRFYEDSTELNESLMSYAMAGSTNTILYYPPGVFSMVYTPSAGTYTYKFTVGGLTSAVTSYVYYCKLIAFEMV